MNFAAYTYFFFLLFQQIKLRKMDIRIGKWNYKVNRMQFVKWSSDLCEVRNILYFHFD